MGCRTFGTSGLRVPELFLAAMTFGEQGPRGVALILRSAGRRV
jgi:aryl-alcohol dehydrogenase-like predicted oxidoreductase